ncbi:MAG TPA: MFS transporter [Solirubrobacterales bacterium]
MEAQSGTGTLKAGVLLAMAMFVFVIDTSLMNVSISAVVRDLDTTVSGVQSAVAVEALVSAAFILIGSKLGDLFGRKRAYVVGLIFYASVPLRWCSLRAWRRSSSYGRSSVALAPRSICPRCSP